CFDRTAPGACVIAPACVLKGVLSDALDAFLDVLDRYTLEDLLGPKGRLDGLLDRSAGARKRRRVPSAASAGGSETCGCSGAGARRIAREWIGMRRKQGMALMEGTPVAVTARSDAAIV